MPKPALRAVDPERPHSRDLARTAIKHWRSDAERQGLPVATATDGKGAPLLDVRQVLGYEDHDRRLGRK